MPDYAPALVLDVFSSAFVDETRFIRHLGGSKDDISAIQRYMDLPIAYRPEVSPFFDREFYWQRYPDIKKVNIDPLVHFIRWGIVEKRRPHPLIDIEFMAAACPDLFSERVTPDALHEALTLDMVDPGPLFSLDFYRSQLRGDEVLEHGLLRHFLDSGILNGFRPNPLFDPIGYYQRVSGRSFDIRSSLRLYFFNATGLVPDAASQAVNEAQTKQLFRAKADATQIFRGHGKLQFKVEGKADLSVIMVFHDNFAVTLQALASLRSTYSGQIELILIDSGSTDEGQHLGQYVLGAHILRLDANVSFVRGSNAGLDIATAESVLYLNNDVEIAPGAVDAAMVRLASDLTIGAVGAKVVRTNGLLQEAGCILWQDGWTSGYMRDKSPLSPEANFVRDVDCCSGVFLLARTSVIRGLGGFDGAFAPAYYEDADLCLRIRAAAYRIVYDPAVIVHHLEFGSSSDPALVHRRIHAAHEIFVERHRERLALQHGSDRPTQVFARSANKVGRRILLIEDQLPLRRLGSGFVQTNDIIRLMAALGHHVTVFPIRQAAWHTAAIHADFPDTVEIMHDRQLSDLRAFLGERRGYYDTIWVARTHNLDLVRPILEGDSDALAAGTGIVLDTEAIGTTRKAGEQALLRTDVFDVDAALREELRNADFCQAVVAVNQQEANLLRTFGLRDVKVLGHMRTPAMTPRRWGERAGLLFVGALHTQNGPNYDSLCWFVDSVLPLVEEVLGYETRLTIAGFVGEGVDLGRFRDHHRVTLRGTVADMTPLYGSHRVFVAPTRFAAGIPYKIHEAASFGLPVVATELLRKQIGWENEEELLAADSSDPMVFARHILALYRSEALWNHIREGGVRRVLADCSKEMCELAVKDILA